MNRAALDERLAFNIDTEPPDEEQAFHRVKLHARRSFIPHSVFRFQDEEDIREVHYESLQNATCWNPRCRLAYRSWRCIGRADDEYDKAGSSIVRSDGPLSSSPPLAWSTASSASLETASQLSEPLLAWLSPGLVRPSPAPSPLSASSLLLSPKRDLLHKLISGQNGSAPASAARRTLPYGAARTAF